MLGMLIQTMSYRKILLGLAIAAVLYFIFGGPIFGPWFDAYANRQDLSNFVAKCPRNEVRLRFYCVQYQEFMSVRVDLTTLALDFDGGGIQKDTWDYFWTRQVRAVFHTITFPLMSPPPPKVLSDQQIAQLQSALSAMPSAGESLPSFEWSNNEGYLAFYRQDQLQVDRFLPGQAPPEFRALCQAIGFRPIFEYWNAGRLP